MQFGRLDMKESILGSFQKLERSKEQILTFLNVQDVNDLERAKEGQWSMIQAIRHVQISEDSIVAYLQKKIQAGDKLPERNLKDQVRLRILFLAIFMRIKFKAPATLADPRISTLDELKKDWKVTRDKMKDFIDKYPDKLKKKAVFRHPAGMRLDILDTLHFLNVHLSHHIHQVGRIKRSLS